MQLKAVVLPAPLGPISPTISHSLTWIEKSRRACRPPKLIDSSCVSRTATDALPYGVGAVGPPVRAAPHPGHHRLDLLGHASRVDGVGEEQQQGGDEVRAELQVVVGEVGRKELCEVLE